VWHVGGGAASWAGPRRVLAEQAGMGHARLAGTSGPTWAVRAVLVGKEKMVWAGLEV
jgi:hypothetical protein